MNNDHPYPSENAKRQIDVMFLTHPHTYQNVKRRSLRLEKSIDVVTT